MTIKYKEHIKKEVKGWKAVLFILAFIIAIKIITEVLIQLPNQRLAGYASVAILILMIAFSFKIINRVITEYEFILTHNALKVEKIIGKRGHKQVLNVKFKQIEYFISEERLKIDQQQEKRKIRKKQNLTLIGMEEKKVIGVYTEQDKLYSFIFQPDEKMLDILRNELGKEKIIL